MTATAAPPRADFDLCGPLPTGTTVLEASAGTGKTHTIASLTARFLAEGEVELGQLLLVTFGRMATNELRLRVRARLVTVEAALTAELAGNPVATDDPLVALLTDVDAAELGRRRARVGRALADFDAATIATTHEFCLQMLDGLGVLGDREPQAVFVEQVTDLTREVATDLYLRRYATWESPPMSYPEAVGIAQQAVVAGHARLVPTADDGESGDQAGAAERVAYAAAARAEVAARLRSGRLFTYDDMLTRLRDALADPERGPAAADRLTERYRVVMVDEFQDTDPIQWEILRRAFVDRSTLILIGDPKQAIYAFRGADVYSYLDAVATSSVQTLATNRRSDAALLDGLDALLGRAALGEPEIVVSPVAAAHQERRLTSPSGPAAVVPVRVRVVPHPPDAERVASVTALRPRITADLVADITAALASDLHLELGGERRRLRPADIAVLVRTNNRGEAIRDALVAAKVPAVLLGSGSVFASALAEDWLTLLVALEQPRQGSIRQAALTCFVGWTFAELAAADETRLSDLTQRVRRWSRVLAGRGVAALVETISTDMRLVERLLARSGGERRLTDLRHLGQSLHAAMVSGQLGVSALVEWLRARMAEARSSTAPEGTRRLETDAKAVSVLTVHRSKGLEFPLVYLPDAWDRHVSSSDEGAILRLHDRPPGSDPDSRGECALDVGGRWGPGRGDRWRRSQAEEAGEDLRLFYVAATRAQCQLVTWWAPSHNTPASALQRLLYRPTGGEVSVPAPAYELEGDPFTARDLGPRVALEPLTDRAPVDWHPTPGPAGSLAARRFERVLDTEWRRTSYSGLTAAVHGAEPTVAGVASEPEPRKEDDESTGPPDPDGLVVTAPATDAGLDRVSPMADLPAGADFGVAVHAVLEAVDPKAPDLVADLRRAAATVLTRLPAGAFTADQLAAALAPALATPLGPLAEGRTLADIPRTDRLAELGFELPLAGGEVTSADVRLGDLVPLLREHLGPTDPLAGYADALADPGLAEQTLRGFLTGSIDAVLRVPGPDGNPRYLVVDYKTNWLGPLDGPPLTLGQYTPIRMAEAMVRAHYPLQALLYAVAVHRLLRWRQPGYDPDRHLGGVLYLFVRGMAGPETPVVDGVPCGVFSWRPPGALVAALSDRLDGDRG